MSTSVSVNEPPSFPLLTEREHQIAQLICEGLSNEQVGRLLKISTGAIKIHLHNIYKKYRNLRNLKAAPSAFLEFASTGDEHVIDDFAARSDAGEKVTAKAVAAKVWHEDVRLISPVYVRDSKSGTKDQSHVSQLNEAIEERDSARDELAQLRRDSASATSPVPARGFPAVGALVRLVRRLNESGLTAADLAEIKTGSIDLHELAKDLHKLTKAVEKLAGG